MKTMLLALALGFANAATHAADLMEVYRQAQANDPTWRAAQAQQRATHEQVTQAHADLRPNVDFTADTFRIHQDVETPTSNRKQQFTNTGYSVDLTHPLYNRPRSAAYAAAQSSASQADYELAVAQHDLMQRVANAYMDVLNAQESLEFARSEKSAVERLLTLARRNFNVGGSSLIDVHESQAAYDLAVSQEIAAENSLENSRQALQVITGVPADNLLPLGSDLALTAPEPNDREKWVETALAQNPALKAQEMVAARAAREVERSRGQQSPSVDIVASHSWDDVGANSSGVASETINNQIGLRLQVPLYSGGGISARVRETLALEDAAQQRLEATKRQVSQQARAAYLAVINGMAQVRALEQARASNRRALESTVLGQERGLRTALDILQNQRTLYRTLRDLANARYNYLLSRLELDAVAGTLNEDDLLDINRLLRPR